MRTTWLIDVEAANDCSVTVCGTESPGNSTMELTWALMLALVRRIPTEDRATRAGHWQVTLGEELHGKTLGIIGLARIGSSVARVARAFGMNVLAWNPSLTNERAAEHGAELAPSLHDLLRRADIVTLHVQLNEGSRGLLGARELALLKPGAYLINTSRGPLIDEAALLAVLREKRIAGAALDVYDREPLPPDHPFLSLEVHGAGTALRLRFRPAVRDVLSSDGRGHRGLDRRIADPSDHACARKGSPLTA